MHLYADTDITQRRHQIDSNPKPHLKTWRKKRKEVNPQLIPATRKESDRHEECLVRPQGNSSSPSPPSPPKSLNPLPSPLRCSANHLTPPTLCGICFGSLGRLRLVGEALVKVVDHGGRTLLPAVHLALLLFGLRRGQRNRSAAATTARRLAFVAVLGGESVAMGIRRFPGVGSSSCFGSQRSATNTARVA